mgnify:CR=1 FL=1
MGCKKCLRSGCISLFLVLRFGLIQGKNRPNVEGVCEESVDNARFTPRYKLMLVYNVIAESHEDYFQFIINEMVPRMQGLGLHMFRAYGTAWGDYPNRQVEFLAETIETVHNALTSSAWRRLEEKLSSFVTDYSRKLVAFRQGFQL